MLEVNSEPCEISKTEYFVELINGPLPLTMFTKCSILDVWQGFKCGSEFYVL